MEDKVDALIKRLGWCKKIDNGITLQYFKKFREGDYAYCYGVIIRGGKIKTSGVVSKHYCLMEPLEYELSEKESLLFELIRAYQEINILKKES